MKNTITPLRFAAAFMALALFASCEKPGSGNQDPDTPGTELPDGSDGQGYPDKANTFVVDGTETPVGSAFAFSYEGFLVFTASPEDATLETVFDGEYIQVAVLPNSLNQEIDLKTSQLQIYVWDDETETSQITADMLKEGSVRIDNEEGSNEYTLLMHMVFTDGTEVGINATAEGEAPEEGSTITINDEANPLRAAFYYDSEGMTYLYFTAGDIDYFEEIDLVYEYVCVGLSEDDLTGNEIDITATDKDFMLMYLDQRPGRENEQMMANGMLEGGSGKISVSRNASDPTHFTADLSLVFPDGTSVSVDFDGTCRSIEEVPEDPELPNEFTCNGSKESINSILVDKSDASIWNIYLSATEGLETVDEFVADWAFKITAPKEAFNGEPAGFSTYKDSLKFEYEGQTWTYPGTGTLTVSLEGDVLNLDFTTYGDVEGHYSGPATIVE